MIPVLMATLNRAPTPMPLNAASLCTITTAYRVVLITLAVSVGVGVCKPNISKSI